ncbi:cytochrome o ubiquinol oxidase subunit I, partial [Enterobacter hormaechei]|nr:cytochrome o ubiquinol oxidase subunit I [Enterobacter hormaechei]
KGIEYKRPAKYEEIHMPRNTAAGVVISAFCLILGFALIWHIWWMAIGSFAGIVISCIVKSFDENVDYYVPVAEVEKVENQRYEELRKAGVK